MADRWERVMDLVEIEWEIDDVSGEPREVDLMVLADCWGADPDVGLGPSLSIEWAKIDGDGPAVGGISLVLLRAMVRDMGIEWHSLWTAR